MSLAASLRLTSSSTCRRVNQWVKSAVPSMATGGARKLRMSRRFIGLSEERVALILNAVLVGDLLGPLGAPWTKAHCAEGLTAAELVAKTLLPGGARPEKERQERHGPAVREGYNPEDGDQ